MKTCHELHMYEHMQDALDSTWKPFDIYSIMKPISELGAPSKFTGYLEDRRQGRADVAHLRCGGEGGGGGCKRYLRWSA
jgi:hypothetical protein